MEHYNDAKKKELLKKIELLKLGDHVIYGGFLYDIVTEHPSLAFELESYYVEAMYSKYWYLRKIGISSLVTKLRIFKKEYIDYVIGVISSIGDDLDVRISSFSAVGEVYFDKKNVFILNLLCEILMNENEDFLIRHRAIITMLEVVGLNLVAQTMKHFEFVFPSEEDYDSFENFLEKELVLFREEILVIRNLLEVRCPW